MKHRYFNKVPPFTPDPEHWTKKSRSWKAKEAYESEDDAWEFLYQHPQLRVQGYMAYRCRVCQKWHVGRSNEQRERNENNNNKGKKK